MDEASKTCRDCGESKPLAAFPPAKKHRDGRGSYCRPCMRVRSKASYRKRRAGLGKTVREPLALDVGMARCPACGQVKPVEEFTRSRASTSGRHAHCRPCHNDQTRESAERLHGSTRDYHLMRRYGLTSADVDRMVEAQGGLCAICQEREPKHVDHDHVTGAARGVLCSCCNQALGNARDRPDLLRAAIDYLERTTWTRERVCTGVYRLTSPRPAAPSRSSSELQRLISSRRG